jgi:hypothetical protein
MAVLILPKLKIGSDVQPPSLGEWNEYPTAAFETIAKSLDYPAGGENQQINSVPTMWALPLTLEMPLYNPNHALHEQAVSQWQGMLAVIALAKVRSFPIQARELDINNIKSDPFAAALLDLLPTVDNALYALNDKSNPWRKVFIWTWNNKPVGMTSPSTIVAPAKHGIWNTLPWWDEANGQLTKPHSHLSDDEKSLLAGWLDLLILSVNNNRPETGSESVNTINGLLRGFRGSLPAPPNDSQIIDEESHQYFGVKLNIGSLVALNYPIKAKECDAGSSHLRVITKDKIPTKPLILIDPDLTKIWDLAPQDIRIHKDRTLANFQIQDLRSGRIGNWEDVVCLEPKDLFLSELTFIIGENALPGGSLPQSNQALNFKGDKVTPLLPINPILLEYFTPAEIVSKLRFHQDGNSPNVRLTLTLYLTGTKGKPEPHQLFIDYRLEEQNSVTTTPILEIWPHFNIPEWTEYYALYSGEMDSNSFQVSFSQAREQNEFESQSFQYITTKFDSFPSHIDCNSENRTIGVILLDVPKQTRLTETWKVGVDFGTSFTNIFINERGGGTRQLSVENLLHLNVTKSSSDDRITALREYFIPNAFLPADKPLPLATILTTRGKRKTEHKKNIFDGRIYIPDLKKFNPSEAHIETNLKWENVELTKLFLSNLCLTISALAAKEGVQNIQWSISYPSAFSRKDIKKYIKTWQDVIAQIQTDTGMTHQCPEQDDLKFFRTESLAMAQYFADKEDCNLVRSSCIDLGGGSADVSIWQDNSLLHQCSFQLAGRDLFSQFVELKAGLIPRLFGENSQDWSNIPKDKFNTKIDVLLRNHSKIWLREKRHNFEEDREFQGLVRLIAIGTSGLYYYVGTILRALKAEGKYTEEKATAVYMGGNGSQLLHWLDSTGTFSRNSEINELFNRMLAIGSGLEEVSQPTQLSKQPKDEAACGLVLSDTKLKGLEKKTKDPLITGETCLLNGEELSATARLEIDDDEIIDISIPKIDQLLQFIDSFNSAIKDLDIEDIKPFDTYKKSKDSSGLDPKYQKELIEKTEVELKSMLLKLRNKSEDVRLDPPFILALKALLKVLAREWAGK